MKLKAVSGIMLTLLLIGILKLGFGIQLVKADPRIWTVDDDGPADFSSIQEAINAASPGDTIYVYNGTYYERVVVNKSVSLIGDETAKPTINATGPKPPSINGTYSTVRISANNVTINGFEIQNPIGDYGIFLNHSSNSIVYENIVKALHAIIVEGGSGNTISDNKVEGLEPLHPCVIEGIRLTNSSNNVVTGNYLSFDCHNTFTMHNSHNNYVAFNYIANHFSPFSFTIWKSNNNSIVGNTIWSWGSLNGHISFTESNDNVLYHNSFLVDWGPNMISIDDVSMNNTWDNGYPSGGNYWSNYTDADTNMDGIGDSSHEVNANNTDHYPLMGIFSDFPVTYLEEIYHVTTVCNSTISAFEFDQLNKIIRFNVTGEEGIGFCRVCIPHDLMEPSYTINIDGHPPQYVNHTLFDNGTHRWIYFTYQHSTHEVIIAQIPVGGIYIPVDKLSLLAPYIGLTILLAVAVMTVAYTKKRKRNTEINS